MARVDAAGVFDGRVVSEAAAVAAGLESIDNPAVVTRSVIIPLQHRDVRQRVAKSTRFADFAGGGG